MNPGRSDTPPAAAPVVEVSRLCRSVTADGGPLLHILEDVSFAIAPGEAVAIVGASGSGKSTLLGLLAGLDSPSSGTVRIRGQDLFALDEDGRAALRGLRGLRVPVVPAAAGADGPENVMLPLELAGRGDARREAEAWLGRVGLAGRLGHYPRQLSGASSSGWRWRGPSRRGRRWCWPTSRPATSTWLPARR
jgi:putative ABC transport system ATP-binding protein